MWVARDKDGTSVFSFFELIRDRNVWKSDSFNYAYTMDVNDGVDAYPNLFPDLKWEDEPIKVELDTRENLIKRLEILYINYYQDSNKYIEEHPGNGYMSFDEYALKNWDNVDMNYFETIG